MGSFLERDFPNLIELAFDAALDGSRWQAFIDGISGSFGGASGILYCFNRERAGPAADIVFNFECNQTFSVSEAEDYLGLNPYPPTTCLREPVGKVGLTVWPARNGGLRQSGELDGRTTPYGIPAAHFGVPLCHSDGRVVLLAVAPRAPSLRKLGESYRQQLELLSPHMIRAIRVAHLAEEARLPEPPVRSMLEAFRACAFVLDAREHIVAMNRLAEQLLRTERVFTLDRLGELNAAAPAHAKRLKGAIAVTRDVRRGGASAPVRLASATTGREYLVWIVPLSLSSACAQGRDAEHRMRFFGVEGTGAKVLLLVCDLHDATGISHEALMTGFSLSRTEARLSAALVAGRSLSDYARETGVSRNTARNQLATIFEKTGTRRQAELVAHIVGTLWTNGR